MTISIRLEGGLGNQMFQYAFGRALSISTGSQLNLDLSFLQKRNLSAKYKSGVSAFTYRDFNLDIFDIKYHELITKERIYGRLGLKISRKLPIDLPFIVTQKNYSYAKKNALYSGLWQSRKYFFDYEDILRKDLVFKVEVKGSSRPILSKIKNSNSVCINVRRTDFIGSWHEICNLDYYQKALKRILYEVENPTFFIFSDDMDWCIKNLKLDHEHYFVDHDQAHSSSKVNFDNYLMLMSNCKNFIIPNSTFAWWAVWLSGGKAHIVISPNKWLAHEASGESKLIDKNWILI